MNNHPWHDVPFGNDHESIVNAIIEIPRGSKAKYEVDKETGLLRLDRVLNTAFYYPINYGFIPRTYAGDGDPLDILVLSQIDFMPLSIVRAQVIGVMRMYDKGEDDKIIAVCADDASVNHIHSMNDLAPHFIHELKHFFMRYKELEPKAAVEIDTFLDREKALEIIQEAVTSYTKDILPKL
jgi:inorganic pyrophosphatase